ncbi:hypothetical protein KAH81_00295 [bacterium]|nr:hypothetical protein [bacterium]
MRIAVFLLLTVSLLAAPLDFFAITDTPEPSTAYNLHQIDVLDYSIEFVLMEGDSTFRWSTEIEFINLSDRDTVYYFDLEGMDFPYCPPVFLYDNDSELWLTISGHYEDSVFAVETGELPIDDTVRIAITGVVTPYGTGCYREPGGGQYWIYTLFWPSLARYAFPCVDHPGDRATATMKIIAPEGMIVAAGGALQDTVPSSIYTGFTEWRFRYDQPVCTYNISFAAGNYAEIVDTTLDTLEVRSYAYPSRLTQTQYDFGRIPEMIALWDSLFGDYPFPRVGCVAVPMDVWGGGGGMEHQMLPQIGDLLITGTRTYEEIIAHELAHQWFGDCIGIADWADFWLNEGIAVYSEVLWVAHTSGASAARTYMNNEESYYKNWTRTNADFPIFDPASFLSPIPYNKGACWWHMLRWQLGDDDFFAFLRYYFARFKFETVVTDSLKFALEDFTSLDWNDFFEQWIYGQGYPKFLYDERIGHDLTGWFVDVNLRQTQVSPSCTLFTTPLPLELVTHDSSIAVIFTPTSRFQWERFRAPDSIGYVVFDRLNYICGDFEFSPVGIEEKNAFPMSFNLSTYPNPFNSAVRISLDAPVGAIHELPLRVEVFDLAGRRVYVIAKSASNEAISTLIEGDFSPSGRNDSAGEYTWTPDESVGSGVYLVRARFDSAQRPEGRTITKRVVYLK